MRPLRDFKTNRCYHLIGRIANRAFFLTDEELTRRGKAVDVHAIGKFGTMNAISEEVL